MGKQVVAIALLVLACALPAFAVGPFDIYRLSHQFGKGRGIFDYYKLALEWPKSVCNTGDSHDKCQSPIRDDFTIHSLQPYYRPDNRVPPYDESNCNAVPPRPAASITEAYLKRYGVLEDMVRYWPNLYGYNDINKNLEFWRAQWTRAGACSSYPVYPDFYFSVALTYRKSLDLLKILESAGIHPNNEKYEAGAFARAIEKKLGMRVQIRCNMDSKNVKQFYEALICVDRLNFLESCSATKFYGCSENEKIQFPSVA